MYLVGCGGGGGGGGGGRDGSAAEASNPSAEALHASIQPVIVRDAKVDDYLRELGMRITTAGNDMGGRAPGATFNLVDGGGVINVATLGAGHLYVTNELLQRCRNEEELAACMAHAYAHLYLHQKPPPARSNSGGDLTVDQLVLARANDRYSPQQEQQADATAYQLYARAGWDPDRYGSFFQAALDSGLAPGTQARMMLSSRATLRVQLPASARDWEQRPSADDTRFGDLKSRAARATQATRGADVKARNRIAALPNCLLGEDQPEQQKAQEALKPIVEDPSDSRHEKGNRDPLHR